MSIEEEIKQLQDKTRELEARIKELEIKCEELQADLVGIDEDINIPHNMARAICELQEHLRDKDDVQAINKIKAPTRVGMQ